jgi:2Fe-2S ferredoxin
VRVHVRPGNFDLDVRAAETLIEAAWRAGYYWPTICQGQGSCLQCFVVIDTGAANLVPAEDWENVLLMDIAEFVEGDVRLACQLRVTGDVVVTRPGVTPLV